METSTERLRRVHPESSPSGVGDRTKVGEEISLGMSFSPVLERLYTANQETKGPVVQYIMLIIQGSTPLPGTDAWEALSQEEQQQVYADYGAINNNPNITSGLPMAGPESATVVQVKDGKALATDGPFVSTKEALGGYFILEAEDLDAAIEVASTVPAARLGGAVEIRPVQSWG